jgi:mono/diheme cytochrome c family protein
MAVKLQLLLMVLDRSGPKRRWLMWRTGTLALAFLTMLTTACVDPRSSAGFRLPDGDVERGKTAFLELRCYTCHTVSGVDIGVRGKEYAFLRSVVLGGETRRVKTYGELVTSIINPSHSLVPGYPNELITKGDESAMANFNDRLTVRQLIDLVAFLQSRYQLVPPMTPGS